MYLWNLDSVCISKYYCLAAHATVVNSGSKDCSWCVCKGPQKSCEIQKSTWLVQGYWLDRSTGGVCYSLAARGLRVVWGDDDRYWSWVARQGSRLLLTTRHENQCLFVRSPAYKHHVNSHWILTVYHLSAPWHTLTWQSIWKSSQGASPSNVHSMKLWFCIVFGFCKQSPSSLLLPSWMWS